MGDVLNFKCPCCGAKLTWSGKDAEMICEYCDAHFTMEQVKAAEDAEKENAASSDMTWTTTEQLIITGEDGKVQGYRCPSCAAEMVADENTAATECPYCGNAAIIPQSFEGMYRPDLMVPFAVEKNKAVEALSEFTKGKKLLPKSFTENNRIEKISGIYVPFWLYSCHADGFVTFEGVKEKKWEDNNFSYVKKDHYHITRSGGMDFDRIPADASTQMDDALMDSLEPYDLGKAEQYDAAYFSGYLADRYDVEEKDARPRADERVTNTFRAKMREAVKDYTEVSQKAESIRLTNAKAEYAMLPVWMLSTRYEDTVYTFGINGQTGKLVGSLPVDKGKYYRYMAIAFAIALVITQALVFLLGGRTWHPTGAAIMLIVSAFIGFIYARNLKAQMNTVAAKKRATEYLREGSLKFGKAVDSFLFSKTEKKSLRNSE